MENQNIMELLSSAKAQWEEIRAEKNVENVNKILEMNKSLAEKANAALEIEADNAEALLYRAWGTVPTINAFIDFSKALKNAQEDRKEEYKQFVAEGLTFSARIAVGSTASVISLKDLQKKLEVLKATFNNNHYIPTLTSEDAAKVIHYCQSQMNMLKNIAEKGDFSKCTNEDLKAAQEYMFEQRLTFDWNELGEAFCKDIMSVAELGKYPEKSRVLDDQYVNWLSANAYADWMLNETLKAGYASEEETVGKIFDLLEELANNYINSSGYKIQNHAFVVASHPKAENIQKRKDMLAKYKQQRWEMIGKATEAKANAYWAEHPQELIQVNEEVARNNERIQAMNAEMSAFMDRFEHVEAKETIAETKRKINELKQEFSRLGFFQGGRKKEILEVIAQLEASLPGLENAVKEQQQALLPEKPDMSGLDALKNRMKELKMVMEFPAKYHHLIEKKEDQQ